MVTKTTTTTTTTTTTITIIKEGQCGSIRNTTK